MIFRNDNIQLNSDKAKNYIQLNNEDFQLSSLHDNNYGNKGASANLFTLIDPSGETEDRVIKICKTPLSSGTNKKIARFKREIKAFQIASKVPLGNVIHFYQSGEVEIDGFDFLYIIMEKADDDLPNYLEKNNFKFTINQKFSFCYSILTGVKQLHSVKIYHRDIKHDNILRVNGAFKIGDLGLITFQNKDFDGTNEKIGPFGWLSPEATNKMLTYKKKIGFNYDCDINNKSDVFQLGKLFWYIFQGNLPIGQIKEDDSNFNETDIYEVIFEMLQYQKSRRPTIEQVEEKFKPLKQKYNI